MKTWALGYARAKQKAKEIYSALGDELVISTG